MARYVLIHGSSSNSGYWQFVAPELEAAGHDVIAPDLPSRDDSAGFEEYADAVVHAAGTRSTVIIVAQSMGAYTAPLVASKVPTGLIVLTAPMLPAAGETAGQWWDNTGQPQAQQELAAEQGFDPGVDMMAVLMHDVPGDVVARLMEQGTPEQSPAIFGRPWPLTEWPDVPTRVLLGEHDRLFPVAMMRQLTRDRLGLTPDEIPAGHLMAFSRPDLVVAKLEQYRADVGL